MDSLYYKKKNILQKKRHTLYSICAGVVFFSVLCILNKYCSFSLCIVKNIFGVSCAGCGMTRGFISILKFDFKSAFSYNVMSIPLFLGILLYCVLFALDLIYDKDYIEKIENQLLKKYMYVIYFFVLVLVSILNNI